MGKTIGSGWPGLWRSVHPHAGGENEAAVAATELNNRFTPTRVGKTGRGLGIAIHQRFTPTRVGKTALPAGTNALGTVHPHAGGENATSL